MRNANPLSPRLIVRVRGKNGNAELGKLSPCSLIPYKYPSRPVHSILGGRPAARMARSLRQDLRVFLPLRIRYLLYEYVYSSLQS